ncbi:mitochondrial thiamine pyrophosphate carrier-like [Prorops nasuta]|uniref:mitochondrial thiamine pyrophosphate carrier-like n=1 Tax=Prorops nasuta TaxID=863751 RepID=UPI0034CD5AD3
MEHYSDHAIAGASSGFITRFISQPLDVLKIRFQLQVEPISHNHISKYRSIFQAILLIYKEEGVTAFWKGHVPAQYLSIVYGMSQFYSYNILLKTSENSVLLQKWKHVGQFISGAGAGFFATVVSYPFDTVRTRDATLLLVTINLCLSEIFNIIKFLIVSYYYSSIVWHESPKIFFAGLLPTLIQTVPRTAIEFTVYGIFTDIYKMIFQETNTAFSNSMIAGSISGFTAKTIVYPFDLARKRMQIQGFQHGRRDFGKFFQCKGLIDCTIKIIKDEGVMGMYKGLIPSQLKAAITSALYFSFYEQSLLVLKNMRQ